jgi:hypothetical protein
MIIGYAQKTALISIAVLFLATGTAHAADEPLTIEQCNNQYVPGAHYDEDKARAHYEQCLDGAKPIQPVKPAAFRPWQQVWQCNDIRIVEFSNQQGLIEYDLSSTIWGGSQFARDLNRDKLFFNGRPCLKVAQ